MRLTLIFTQLLAAGSLIAAPLDPKVLQLVPDNARFIIGVDLTLYRRSALAEIYRFSLDDLIVEPGADALGQVQQALVVQADPHSGGQPLFILSGALAAVPPAHSSCTVLDSKTAICAEPETTRTAVSRWRAAAGDVSEIASKVKSLSESYDNWFLAVRPFENLDDHPERVQPTRYRREFTRMVEEARGGIRLGRTNEFRAEVTMKTSEDAAAVAALSRWLPGVIQMQDSGSLESELADLADNFVVMSAGNTVSLSFALDESRVQEVVMARRARQKDDSNKGTLQ